MDQKTASLTELEQKGVRTITYVTSCGKTLPKIKDDDIIPVYPYPARELKAVPYEYKTDIGQSKLPLPDETVALMINTMYKMYGIGLASTQVGLPYRLVVWDTEWHKGEKKPSVIYNPEITETFGEAVTSHEGCLSVPFDYRDTVKRNDEITVSGYDASFKPIHFVMQGMEAICMQHEIDHLNGKLFIDKLSRLKRDMYHRKVKKFIKKYKRGLQSGEIIADEALRSR